MSALSKLFLGQKSKDSRETLAKELLTKTDLYTKTDIPKPLALAIADALALTQLPPKLRNAQLKSIFPEMDITDFKMKHLTSGMVMSIILYFYRVNAISKNRKSRGEFVTALQQTQFESDVAKRRVEKMFGLQQE